MTMSKQELRQQLLAARRSVPSAAQELAAKNLSLLVQSLDSYASAANIALYWPHDGEISPLPLLYEALAQHKHCYLPVLRLQPRQNLAFASYNLDTPLVINRYGILEPEISYAALVEPGELDIIFMPLVGFDKHGSRLGRGGGFYDASFANFFRSNQTKVPKLVGLGYACQEVEQIPTDSWDWQLDSVVTEEQTFNFNPVSK